MKMMIFNTSHSSSKLLSSFCLTTSSFKSNSPYLSFITISNIVFGLVTAVVIQELGEEAHETSLYYRFLETYCTQKRRSKEYRFRNELVFTGCRGKVRQYWSRVKEWGKTRVMGLILWSTRLYIIFWIGLGVASLAFGAIEGLDPSNTLYTTGQTWLGIAVTIGYAYFGLSGKNAPSSAANSNENEQQQQSNVTRNSSGQVEGSIRSSSGSTNILEVEN